jgi:hypothetical protein
LQSILKSAINQHLSALNSIYNEIERKQTDHHNNRGQNVSGNIFESKEIKCTCCRRDKAKDSVKSQSNGKKSASSSNHKMAFIITYDAEIHATQKSLSKRISRLDLPEHDDTR